MKLRHELKHSITFSDAVLLKSRLSAIAKQDAFSIDGKYEIRSLYFDTPSDRALREKIDGVNIREKFRLRLYNGNTDLIKLEKKMKINGLCKKESLSISKEIAEALSNGVLAKITNNTPPLLAELYTKMSSQRLLPKTIVDYTREAYVYPAGNVRVTIDSNIRTGLNCTDFLNPDCITIPAGDLGIILEVKWDEFIPRIILDAVAVPNRFASAFSKYAVCRRFG
ncbi:MAG: polyphosphate polymerase domain-containing protein [Oscillospiraceae bacterium]|nr:polyphosphate polymerase domain-containing protein [Oscillospiraceae bacterium]